MPGRILAPDPMDVAFQVVAVGISRAEIRHASNPRQAGRNIARRAAVHWDARMQPAASQVLFRLMHSEMVLTLPLHAVIKPSGILDAYHLSAEAAATLIRMERLPDAYELS